MESALKASNIDIQKQLSLDDAESDFRKYFLRKKDVSKIKVYQLLVNDAQTLSKVLINLEKVKIANVNISKIEYSKVEEVKLWLKEKAILKAKKQAETLAKPLGQTIGKAFFIQDIGAPIQADGWYPKNSNKRVFARGFYSETEKTNFSKITISASVKVKFYLN